MPCCFNAWERNRSDAPCNTQALGATEQSVAAARAEVGELENRCRAAEQQAEQLEALLENPETEAAIAKAEKAAAAAMQHAEASPLSLTPSYQQTASSSCGRGARDISRSVCLSCLGLRAPQLWHGGHRSDHDIMTDIARLGSRLCPPTFAVHRSLRSNLPAPGCPARSSQPSLNKPGRKVWKQPAGASGQSASCSRHRRLWQA